MFPGPDDYLNGDVSHYGDHEDEGNETNIPEFLRKTFHMVSDPETDNFISWDNTGEGFVVYNEHEFSANLLPRYFRHGNFASFIRQLNSFGFRKRSVRERSYLKHPHFKRGQFDDMVNIVKKPPTKEGSGQLADEMKALRAEVRRLQGRYDEMLQAQRQILFWLAHHTQNTQQRGRTPSTAIPIPDRRGDPSKRPRLQLMDEPWDPRSNDSLQEIMAGVNNLVDENGQPFQVPGGSFPRLEAVNDDGGWSPIEYVKGQEPFHLTKSPVMQALNNGSPLPQLYLPAAPNSPPYQAPLSPSSMFAPSSPPLLPADSPPLPPTSVPSHVFEPSAGDSPDHSPSSPTNYIDLSALRSLEDSASSISSDRTSTILSSLLANTQAHDPNFQALLQTLLSAQAGNGNGNHNVNNNNNTYAEVRAPSSPNHGLDSPASPPPPTLPTEPISPGTAAHAAAVASSASFWPGTQSFQPLAKTYPHAASTAPPLQYVPPPEPEVPRKGRGPKVRVRPPPPPAPAQPRPSFKSPPPSSPVNPFQWEDTLLSDCQSSRKTRRMPTPVLVPPPPRPSDTTQRTAFKRPPPTLEPEALHNYPAANGWDPSFSFFNEFDPSLHDQFHSEEGLQAPLSPIDSFRAEL